MGVVEESSEMEVVRKLVLNYEAAHREGLAPNNPQLEAMLAAMRKEPSLDAEISLPGRKSDHTKSTRCQEIVPEPFFVVKTSDCKKKKVFINICGSSMIDAPGEWDKGVPEELEQLFVNADSGIDDSAVNLRFPLSCSEILTASDRCGNSCEVCDVVYNSLVMRQAMHHKRLKVFLIEMAMSWIGQKHKIKLKHEFKILNMKYKGEKIQKHYINAPMPQLVTELPDATADMQPSFPLLCGTPSVLLNSSDKFATDFTLNKNQKTTTVNTKLRLCSSSICKENDLSTCNDTPGKNSFVQGTETTVSEEPTNIFCDERRSDCTSSKIDLICPEEANINPLPLSVSLTNEERCTNSTTFSNHLDSSTEADGKNIYVEKTELHTSLEGNQTTTGHPSVDIQYIGNPVDLLLLFVTIPSSVDAHNLAVFCTNTKIYIESNLHKTIEVDLPLPTLPNEAKAFLSTEGILQVSLPYFPYVELYRE